MTTLTDADAEILKRLGYQAHYFRDGRVYRQHIDGGRLYTKTTGRIAKFILDNIVSINPEREIYLTSWGNTLLKEYNDDAHSRP